MLENESDEDCVLSGQVVKELAWKGLALEGADTRSKCTTQNVKNLLSLNALHAISISKRAGATKRSKLIGGTVGSKGTIWGVIWVSSWKHLKHV